MTPESRAYIGLHALMVDQALVAMLPVSALDGAERLNHAISYAVFSGGKRMRPILTLLAAEACCGKAEVALAAACGIELLHTASLIFDDLPAMDDAPLRRGRATLHRVFGEDTAILAGLALLNRAYAAFAKWPELLWLATDAIGVNGMIGGQAADVAGAHSQNRLEKTTALTRLTMAAGAIPAGATHEQRGVLAAFGEALGKAYQICDDLADAMSTEREFGKTVGQDNRHGRHTAVAEFTRDEACGRVRDLVDSACGQLHTCFGLSRESGVLEDFARSIVRHGLELLRHDSTHSITGVCGADRVERDTLASSSSA